MRSFTNPPRRLSFWLLVTLLLASCVTTPQAPASLPASTPLATVEPPTPVPPASATPTPTQQPALIETQLKNATYHLPQYDRLVTLVDGRYQGTDGVTTLDVSLLSHFAYGDLNSDALPDAAVLLAENSGGSGVFVSLVVMLNQGGQPVQSGSVYIDDRPVIENLSIQAGRIVLQAIVHQIDDPMVSPSLPVTQSYQLEGDVLMLTRLTSQVVSGIERAIFIDNPLPDEAVSNRVQVKGHMPIGPFENNLACRLYDAAGNLLDAQPFSVQAPDMGAPAVFDNQVALPALPAGSVVWLELAELSPADGSPIAVARVRLNLAAPISD